MLELLRDKTVYIHGPKEAPDNSTFTVSANLHWIRQADIVYAVNSQLLINAIRSQRGIELAPRLKQIVITSRQSKTTTSRLKLAGVPVGYVDRYQWGYNATTGIAAAKHLLTFPIAALHVRGMDLYGGKVQAGAHPMTPQAHDWLEMQNKDPRLVLCDDLLAACHKLKAA